MFNMCLFNKWLKHKKNMDKRKQKTLFTKMNIKIITNDELTELEINCKKDRKHLKFRCLWCFQKQGK